MTNCYTKLKDGSWGLQVAGPAKAGEIVIVSKKSGESKCETIAQVLWTGNNISLCSIAPGANGSSSSSRTGSGTARRGVCVSCGESCNPAYRRCLNCVDGGGGAHGGSSYHDRNGNFVLGDDD